MLGEIGKGHRIAFNILNIGRIKLGVGAIGAAKYALEVWAKYAKERKQFGKPIGAFGLVASKIAEMAIGIFVGESDGLPDDGPDRRARFAAGSDDERDKSTRIEEYAVEASIIKVFGSEVLDYCADECVQIHGGYGYIEEYQIERAAARLAHQPDLRGDQRESTA